METDLKKTLLEKLNGFLIGDITKQEVYEWAQNIVVGPEYEKICNKNKLVGEAIQALFELHHEGEEIKFDPSRDELIYYKECLEGKRKFKNLNK